MPFTRHPLDYQINRLLLKVGMALQSWLVHQPPIENEEDRKAIEEALAEEFGLYNAIDSGLLRAFRFRWRPTGELRTIHLIPSEKFKRVPGLKAMHEIFFKRRWK